MTEELIDGGVISQMDQWEEKLVLEIRNLEKQIDKYDARHSLVIFYFTWLEISQVRLKKNIKNDCPKFILKKKKIWQVWSMPGGQISDW